MYRVLYIPGGAGFLPSMLYQPQNSHFKQRTGVVRSSLERMLKDNQDQLALQRDDYLKFNQVSFAMAQIHRHVSQHFADEGLPLFSDIPKIHCWLHTVLASQFLNPRLTWCFRQEDNMNAHRTLAQSCCKGIRGPPVTTRMVTKCE